MRVLLAANHWSTAIETHASNHPGTDHRCADINVMDMRSLPSTDVLWASVICTEISPAGGRRRRPLAGQLDLLEELGPVPSAGLEHTRATAMDVVRAAEVHRYRYVVVENVVEFVTRWELFSWWRQGMRLLGYSSQIVSVNSAHIWDEESAPAPQWRDRVYIVFTREGVPVPDLAPRPLAWCPVCSEHVAGVQSWHHGRSVGRYRRQYEYRYPNGACRHQVAEPLVRPAASVIDWSDPGTRIGDRARPLAEATMRKIRSGLVRYREVPSMVSLTHGSHAGPRSAPAWSWPMPTRTVRNGDGILTPPGAFVAELRGGGSSTRTVTEPLATLATGRHHGLVVPSRSSATCTDEGPDALCDEEVAAARFRMLAPREALLGQRFPASYRMAGGLTEQAVQAGNAVSVNVARWIGARLSTALGTTTAQPVPALSGVGGLR